MMKTKRRAVEEEVFELVLVKEGDVGADGGRRRSSLQAREGDDLMLDSLKLKTNEEGDESCFLFFF